MAKNKNAIPYLINFLAVEKLNWLNFLGNEVLLNSDQKISVENREKLLEILISDKDFLIKLENNPIEEKLYEREDGHSNVILNNLSDFENYKKLSNGLFVEFHKRCSILFGTNGSGKTSISTAIKILGNTLKPESPLENVFSNVKNQPPTFSFKFSNGEKLVWNTSNGFGQFHQQIKFFDSKISINYLSERPDTNKVIELAPFKLEIFEYLTYKIEEFRGIIQEKGRELEKEVYKESLILSNLFKQKNLKSENVFENINFENLESLKSSLIFSSEGLDTLTNKKAKLGTEINDLIKLTSKEGIKALEVELSEINLFQANLKKLNEHLKKLKLNTYLEDLKKMDNLKAKQDFLIKDIAPRSDKVTEFKEFIKNSKAVIDYTTDDYKKCILCGKDIDDTSLEVINSYYGFLNSTIEVEIQNTSKEIKSRKDSFNDLKIVHITVSANIPLRVKDQVTEIILKLEKVNKFTEKGKEYLESDALFGKESESFFDVECEIINKIIIDLNDKVKKSNLATIENTKQLAKSTNDLNHLLYKEFLFQNKELVNNVSKKITELELFNEKSDVDFASILRRKSAAAKNASDELLVVEFKAVFNKHYEDIAEKDLLKSGVEIVPFKDGGIDVKVGKNKIHQVFSEGEQKIYALALFFAELDYEGGDIVVFDDPVSSLDYHYVDSFCRKLKNFIVKNPKKQIIIFTHDWYFLKDMQDCFNGVISEKDFDILKINNCHNVEKNIESLDILDKQINSYLEKESLPLDDIVKLSQDMRTLIETVINKHVFNNQRTQYKRDKLNPSVFSEYVSLVPLSKEEVLELDDLYAALSKYNHDNPIRHFKGPDLDQFKNRYERINKLKSEFIRRKKEAVKSYEVS